MKGTPRVRVLLVEDEDGVRESTAALLSDAVDVIGAASGEEALRLLHQHPIDVICTDYSMPGMDGIELLRRISDREEFVGGVLVTGLREVAGYAVLDDLSCAVVIKPYKPETLLSAIERAASVTRMRRSSTAALAAAERAAASHGKDEA